MAGSRISWLCASAAATIAGLVATSALAQAPDIRIEGNLGINSMLTSFGTNIEVFDDLEGNVKLKDFAAGDGLGGGLQFWVDDWIGKNWSIGLQWLYTEADSDSEVKFSFFDDIRIARAKLDADLTFNTFFVNLAYRNNDRETRWHPYFGVGVGGGFVDIEAKTKLRLLTGRKDIQIDESSGQLGVQGYFGFDFDITENFYAGVNGRYYYINANPIDLDIAVSQVVFMGALGIRFPTQ